MNINKNISKLLYALKQKGQLYKINSFKFYSEKNDKYNTKYQILAQIEIPQYNKKEDKMEIKKQYVEMKECYSKIDLMKFLAEEYKEIGSEADEQ